MSTYYMSYKRNPIALREAWRRHTSVFVSLIVYSFLFPRDSIRNKISGETQIRKAHGHRSGSYIQSW